MARTFAMWGWIALFTAVVGLSGCKTGKTDKADYTRALPPGAAALRKVPAEQWPSLDAAIRGIQADRASLLAALDRSVDWFAKPSSRDHFPMEGITHEHARASTVAMRDAVAGDPAALASTLREQFDLYMSVGWNGEGVVLFTGYFSPVFEASHARTPLYRYPLYKRPTDLASDPGTGAILGREVGGRIVPYPTRREIERDPAAVGLDGQELVYLKNPLDAFIVHVNGSAKLMMTDGSVLYVGYAGNNGAAYTSIGKLLVADGKLDPTRVSLPTIQQFFRNHPEQLDHYLLQNDRFVFFQPYPGENWPAGSLGLKVEPWRSLATDKSIFPRGGPVLVTTQLPQADGLRVPWAQFMVDQDTGGAIRAPGRADIYMGVGEEAAGAAGRQAAEGRLYYFFLKR